MPEGVSPEIKRAPDAPKAGSGSSPGERPSQPKTEYSPSAPRHPSETFPWLDRETYLQRRDQFVSEYSPGVALVIGGDTQFAYRDNPEITRTAATLFSRALFVAEYLDEHRPVQSTVPVTTWSASHYGNSRLIAETQTIYAQGEKENVDITQVSSQDVQQLKLKHVHIYFNIQRLGKHFDFLEKNAQKGVSEEGHPVDFEEAWKAKMIDEEGIEQERCMVEEMAHAFYIMQAASNPESLRGFIEETRNYRVIPPDRDEDLPPEEKPAYEDAPIEQDGKKWVAAFMQRYYPNVEHESLAARVEQKPPTP